MSTILITGATSGLGRHAALHLAQRGHRVIATGRRAHALADLQAEATAQNLQLDTVPLDVTSAGSIHAAVVVVDELTQGRGIDVLVNNAGFGQFGAVLDVPLQDWRKQYETNVFGLVEVTRAFVPAMVRRGQGRVVNISSVGGRFTVPLLGVYNSTKYAVESLSDALRRELAGLGIHVSLIEPGAIHTAFGGRAMSNLPDADSPWGGVYARGAAMANFADRVSPGPLVVSRAITRAVESRWPRARYVAPGWYRALFPMLLVVPTRVVDAVVGFLVGLPSVQRIPATATEQP